MRLACSTLCSDCMLNGMSKEGLMVAGLDCENHNWFDESGGRGEWKSK